MRAQASTEYIMIIGFVSFAVLGVLVLAYVYANSASDSIKQNELENMADKLISTSEYVYYSGAPAQATIIVYVPEDIKSMSFEKSTIDGITYRDIKITHSSSSGTNIQSFSSNVDITLPSDGDLSRMISKGAKRLKITATDTGVTVLLQS